MPPWSILIFSILAKTGNEIFLSQDMLLSHILDRVTNSLIVLILVRILRLIKQNLLKRYDTSIRDNLQARKCILRSTSLKISSSL